MEAMSLRQQLGEGAGSSPTGVPSLREWLRARLDLAQYRPQALPSAVVSRLAGREGRYAILKNPDTKTYYRISDRDFFLWERMDGSRTVKDLVVAYFVEYKTFAFARVAALVQGLKANGLLVDQPTNLYGHLRLQLARRRPQSRLMGLTAAVMGKRFAVGGLDRLLSGVYRLGARILYAWPALLVYILLAAGGLYCFVLAFRRGGYGIAQINGSYAWGAIGLAAVYLIAIFLHESAHALTVKHYRREVRRGGFMLYMGMPGFFVDTTDIWMEGKRARLAVTWAGPYSGLILAGLASLVTVLWPEFVLNGLLFQFAFLTYILVFFNLNPLLELDGYYMLMDWLEIPGLRRKSFDFLRRGLVARLKAPRQAGRRVRELVSSFSWEERIFAVFGLLSLVWTAYALFAAARIYQSRIATAIRGLSSRELTVAQTILAVVMLLLSLLVAAGMAFGLWSMVRGLWRAAARRGMFRGWKLATILVVLALILALLASAVGNSNWLPYIGLAFLAVAAALWAWNGRDLAGAGVARVFWMLGGAAVALCLKEAVALAQTMAWLRFEVADPLGAGLGLLAVVCLYAASLALFADTDLKRLGPWEKGVLAAGLAAAFLSVLPLAASLPIPLDLLHPRTWLEVAGPAAAGLLLVVLVPVLVSYWRTPLAPAWTLLALATMALLVTAMLGFSPVLPYLLMAGGAVAFHGAFNGLAVGQAHVQATFGLTDALRLDRAFASTVRGLYREWRAIGGERETRALLSELNSYALAAGWRIQVVQGEVEQSLSSELPLGQRGETYASSLTLLLDLMAHQAGEKLTIRALQRAYDSLPWDQREVAAQYVFSQVRRAETLSREFQSTQRSYRALLRRIPLFATMDDQELDLLCSQLRVEELPAGRTVIRQGEAGDRFYIVHRGHIEVTQRDANGVSEVVEQLDRGKHFGELALLHDAPRNATCRTTVPTELLSLSRADFERLVKVRFELKDTVDRSLSRAALLRAVPFFSDMDGHQIQLVATQMRDEDYAPGQEIIRQGEIGETFYVIESGRVQTVVRQNGVERVVAERGPGEYVGEIALLMQVPRTATVRALTPVRVLVLDRKAFDDLVSGHLYVSRGLEREASRRMMGLRHEAQGL